MVSALLALNRLPGLERVAAKLVAKDFKLHATLPVATYLRQFDIEVTVLPMLIRAEKLMAHEVLRTDVFDALLIDDEWTKLPKFDLVFTDIDEPADWAHRMLIIAALERSTIPILTIEDCEMFLTAWESAPDDASLEEVYRSLVFRADLMLAKSMLRAAAERSSVELFHLIGNKVAQPIYGENPHQESYGVFALAGNGRVDDPLAIPRFSLVKGAPLSHNNYLDLSRALDTMTRVAAACHANALPIGSIAVGVKHGIVCGAAHFGSEEVYDSIRAMIEGQPRDIFGGVVILNKTLDEEGAQLLLSHATLSGRVLDVVAAPCITTEARQILSRKNDKCRMLVNEALAHMSEQSLEQGSVCVMVRGAVLVQEASKYIPRFTDPPFVREGNWTTAQLADLLLAWAVGSSALSNSITLVKGGMLVGFGIASTSRVDACSLAVRRADILAKGSVAYSDSFFPFLDGLEVLIEHGVTHIFTTLGSRMDARIKQRMREAGLSVCTVSDALGRGFRH